MMKRSTERILTTHAGSLIRPPESVAAFDRARAAGRAVDEAAYDAALQQAVNEVVRKQAEAGIDIVGRRRVLASRAGAPTSTTRVSGFQHDAERDMAINYTGRDSERFAEFFDAESGGQAPATAGAAPTSASGPSSTPTTHSIHRDIANLKAAAAAAGVEEAFLPVVAPASAAFNGVNDYYKTDEEYVYALAEALRNEYLAISESGLVLQVDDAVLANAYDDLMAQEPGALPQVGGAAHRGAEPRPARHPRGPRALPPLLRQLARPARLRRAAGGDRRPHPAGQRRRLLHRGGQRAPRARVAGLGRRQAAGGQDPHPRRRHPPHHLASSTRAWSPTASSATPTSSAARTSSPARTAASSRAPASSASTRRSCGPSCESLAEGARIASQRAVRLSSLSKGAR